VAKPAVVPRPVAAVPAAAKEAETVAKPKGKSRLVIVLAILLLLGGAGGGGAWWYFNQSSSDAHPKAAAVKPPVFHALEPFTINLLEENGDHYLQIAVVYQVDDEKTVDQLKTYLPIIRNRILMLLSSKRPSDLSTPEGKQKLVVDLVSAAREALPATTPERGIKSAYLGAFVIQ
jgi:flagellar protein FliL